MDDQKNVIYTRRQCKYNSWNNSVTNHQDRHHLCGGDITKAIKYTQDIIAICQILPDL